ncbi:hypothetical protein [Hymenobacter fodinae]|uniref:Lipoprotein n=1 Tax=Hymenobacter fodinae TaxID=2510796 RepID=A0A4Z0P7Y8_9BACT|nr:hypothetical protein [Hymenobacter fodinae]TGE08289.1 hypothetical protein EU556_11245 [Hymenobacter fodinae]
MKRTSTLVAGGILALVVTGCVTCVGENEPCADATLPTTSLEKEYGCTDSRRQLSIGLDQTYTIIRNQADFDKLVTGSCHPQIDFTKYDLVIGNKGTASGSSSIAYTYARECETGQLKLRVKFTQGMTNDAPILTYHALVPKLAPQETVQVDVEM